MFVATKVFTVTKRAAMKAMNRAPLLSSIRGSRNAAEKERRKELTQYERFIEKWDERGNEIEEALRKLRGE